MNTDASPLRTWIELMTADELAELAASFAWTTSYVDWSARPAIVAFLQSLDALIIAEQRRRADADTTLDETVDGVTGALSWLAKTDVQVLLHSWTRIARNRERDQSSSEPVQRFHTAVSDLLHAELARRLVR
jgi:hypothetical protein